MILSLVIIQSVLMASLTLELSTLQNNLLVSRQVSSTEAFAQTLATSGAVWVASLDLIGLQEIIDSQESFPELLYAIITDDTGFILAHTDKSRRGQYLTDLPQSSGDPRVRRNSDLIDALYPVRLDGKLVGWVRVGIGQKAVKDKLNQIALIGVSYIIVSSVLASLISWWLGHLVTRRLYAVQKTMNKVRNGDTSARSIISGRDEVTAIAGEFNTLLDTLAASEFKYRTLLDKIRIAVVVHGPDSRIIMSNPMAQELLGMDTQDPKWNFVHEDGTVVAAEDYPVSQTLRTSKSMRDVVMGIQRESKEGFTWVMVSTFPMFQESGTISEVIVTFIDITSRRISEQKVIISNQELEQRIAQRTADLEEANTKLKEMDQLKSLFIASMSHELRTPLNSILGYSSILVNEWIGPLNEEQKGDLSAVLRSGKHLLSLINDVIDVSKIEAGKIESTVVDFDIGDLIQEVVDTVRKEAERKNLDIKTETVPCTLHTDRRRLLQCLLNIVTNSIKYTEIGTIRLSSKFQEDGKILVLTVEDTGIGIREEDREKLFLPFVRLQDQQLRTVTGTGLGLYLSRKLVRDIMKGDIRVESVYGKGSRFEICLPLETGGVIL